MLNLFKKTGAVVPNAPGSERTRTKFTKNRRVEEAKGINALQETLQREDEEIESQGHDDVQVHLNPRAVGS